MTLTIRLKNSTKKLKSFFSFPILHKILTDNDDDILRFMNRLAVVVSEVRINFHVKDHNWIVIESPVPPSVPVKQSNFD